MLQKTRGIIFKTTAFSESSIVAQIFTEKFGLQSYIIQGVKKPKAKIRQNMLQPLHLAEMVVYHKQNGNIQRISELRQQPVLTSIPYNVIKSSLVLFLNEILYKSVRHQNEDQRLFEYIFNSIEYLDRVEGNILNFHLSFLIKLTGLFGFSPDTSDPLNSGYFDLKEGFFVKQVPFHQFYIEPPLTEIWLKLLRSNFDQASEITITNNNRRVILEKILDYFRLHIDGFGEIKSHHVLEIVLS